MPAKNKLILISILILLPASATAIPPPDFIINVGSQLAQFFSIAVLFLSALVVTFKDYLKTILTKFGYKKIGWLAIIILIVLIAGIATYFYNNFEQQNAIAKWQQEQTAQNIDQEPPGQDTLESIQSNNHNSLLVKGNENNNDDIEFIIYYYDLLSRNQLGEAYEFSSQSVPYKTYTDWYRNVQAVKITSLTPLAEERTYEVNLRLTENNLTNNYRAVLQLITDQDKIKIISSEATPITSQIESTAQTSSAISNKELANLLTSGIKPFILDAREDEEFTIGSLPSSTHIRYGDILAGEWHSLPTDQTIYVICWSGIRGKEVSDFLNEKGLNAIYLENGANDWVKAGGTWEGEISFAVGYPNPEYKLLLTSADVTNALESGNTIIVDARREEKFNRKSIPGSLNIPVIYSDSKTIQQQIARIPKGSQIISVCDDFVSCFAAKIIGVKVQAAGHEFIGRFNKPWEWQ